MLKELMEKLESMARQVKVFEDPDRVVVQLPNGALHTIDKANNGDSILGSIGSFAAYVVDNIPETGPVHVFVNRETILAVFNPCKNLSRLAHLTFRQHEQWLALRDLHDRRSDEVFFQLNTRLKGCFDEALAPAIGSIKIKREQHLSVSMVGGGKTGRGWRIECGEDGGATLPAELKYTGRVYDEWPNAYEVNCALAVNEDGLFSIVPANTADVLAKVREDILEHLSAAFEGHPVNVYIG